MLVSGRRRRTAVRLEAVELFADEIGGPLGDKVVIGATDAGAVVVIVDVQVQSGVE